MSEDEVTTEAQKMLRQTADSWATVKRLVRISKRVIPREKHEELKETVKTAAGEAHERVDATPRPGNGIDADIDDLAQVLKDISEMPDETEETEG